MSTSTVARVRLPRKGTYLTDGERLVLVMGRADLGVWVEDARTEEEFVISEEHIHEWEKVRRA